MLFELEITRTINTAIIHFHVLEEIRNDSTIWISADKFTDSWASNLANLIIGVLKLDPPRKLEEKSVYISCSCSSLNKQPKHSTYLFLI